MISFSFISLLSGLISIAAILIVFSIFNRVFQEKYKRPWFYIGVSAIFLSLSQLLQFASASFNVNMGSQAITEIVIYLMGFISASILTYGLLLELLILKYYKGKFIKMKFIPVLEETLDGEMSLDVSKGCSYLAFKKDKDYMYSQFAEATRKGFEGFLLTENNPKNIRTKYLLKKTPIGWISHIDSGLNSVYLEDSLDENSDVIDPLQLNNLINYIDNFLEQSQNPFILLELNLILRTNNYAIALEFLKYISSKTERYRGILIYMINIDILKKDQMAELHEFLTELK